jgi:hypothetical protein
VLLVEDLAVGVAVVAGRRAHLAWIVGLVDWLRRRWQAAFRLDALVGDARVLSQHEHFTRTICHSLAQRAVQVAVALRLPPMRITLATGCAPHTGHKVLVTSGCTRGASSWLRAWSTSLAGGRHKRRMQRMHALGQLGQHGIGAAFQLRGVERAQLASTTAIAAGLRQQSS